MGFSTKKITKKAYGAVHGATSGANKMVNGIFGTIGAAERSRSSRPRNVVISENDPLVIQEELPTSYHSSHTAVTTDDDDDSISLSSSRSSSNFRREPPHATRSLQYDQDDHLAVLFRMHGSVWPHVMPYCVASVVWTLLLHILQQSKLLDITFESNVGHNFMAMVVSFLVVSRSNITYSRFMEARGHLSKVYRSCREVIHQSAAVFTMHDQSKGAQEWRREVAYRTIAMLRVAMAVIEYRSSNIHTWEVLHHEEDAYELQDSASEMGASMMDTSDAVKIMNWAHGDRSMVDENFRAPIILAYNLREAIMKQRNGQYLQERMGLSEEIRISNCVGDFLEAFHGLKKLITCPFPLPYVQMTRTFLFFWIFSLPMVLLNQMTTAWQTMLLMFFVTYGFLGIEYVSMELDDPFGDDPTDFDDLGMAEMIFEDIYIAIYKVDGARSAQKLRDKVAERIARGNALDDYRQDIQKKSFWRSERAEAKQVACSSTTPSVENTEEVV